MKPLSDKTAGFTDSVIRRMQESQINMVLSIYLRDFRILTRRRKSQTDCVKSHRTDRISMP